MPMMPQKSTCPKFDPFPYGAAHISVYSSITLYTYFMFCQSVKLSQKIICTTKHQTTTTVATITTMTTEKCQKMEKHNDDGAQANMKQACVYIITITTTKKRHAIMGIRVGKHKRCSRSIKREIRLVGCCAKNWLLPYSASFTLTRCRGSSIRWSLVHNCYNLWKMFFFHTQCCSPESTTNMHSRIAVCT